MSNASSIIWNIVYISSCFIAGRFSVTYVVLFSMNSNSSWVVDGIAFPALVEGL
jgi:hypothetical protein